MSGLSLLRVAALCAFVYAALAVAGLVVNFQHTGSLRALAQGLMHHDIWLVFLIALVVAVGVWSRYAWAWWMGIAAAAFQLFRLVSPYVNGARFPQAFAVLLAIALLLAFLVLVIQRKARLACNR